MSKQIVEKGWGREIIFASNEMYCGKLLQFDKTGSKGSMHYHMKKDETFMVVSGSFILRTIDQKTAQLSEQKIETGHVVRVIPGFVHQLEAIEDDSQIFEVSSQDDPDDSYRVMPGDSQR